MKMAVSRLWTDDCHGNRSRTRVFPDFDGEIGLPYSGIQVSCELVIEASHEARNVGIGWVAILRFWINFC